MKHAILINFYDQVHTLKESLAVKSAALANTEENLQVSQRNPL